MTVALVLGSLFGASLCLLAFSIAAPRRGLATTVVRWQHQQAAQTSEMAARRRRRVGRVLAGKLAEHGFTFPRVKLDLELLGTTFEEHMARKVLYGATGLLLPVAAGSVMGLSGVAVPLVGSAGASLALAGVLFWVPDVGVAQEADRRRHELRRALSCYLDLVAMSLAGGRGVPEALPMAARIGTGWAFSLINDTIEHARYVGTTPWAAFADLGKRVGVPELEDLGGALMLVADDGAKVRTSLAARASTQRRRQLAEAEGAAASADQSIQMAQVVLALGFFLFLGYPALVAVLGI